MVGFDVKKICCTRSIDKCKVLSICLFGIDDSSNFRYFYACGGVVCCHGSGSEADPKRTLINMSK